MDVHTFLCLQSSHLRRIVSQCSSPLLTILGLLLLMLLLPSSAPGDAGGGSEDARSASSLHEERDILRNTQWTSSPLTRPVAICIRIAIQAFTFTKVLFIIAIALGLVVTRVQRCRLGATTVHQSKLGRSAAVVKLVADFSGTIVTSLVLGL